MGAKYPCLVRATTLGRPTRTTIRRQAPSRFALRRRITEGVLARQLIGDLRVDAGQLRRLRREERAPAGFLRELPQHEFGFLESLGARRSFRPAQPDRVDRGFRALREIQHLFERQQARGVLAVREDDDRLAADFLHVGRDDLLQILERDVDRVVHRGGTARRCAADRRFEILDLVRECLQDDHAAVEVDQFLEILRTQRPRESNGRFLRDRQSLFHARTGVHEDGQRDRQVGAVEDRDVLLDAVFEDLEIVLLQVGDVAGRLIGDRDVHRHEFDAGAKWRLPSTCRRGWRRRWRRLLLLRRRGFRNRLLRVDRQQSRGNRDGRGDAEPSEGRSGHHRSRTTFIGVPRTVNPGLAGPIVTCSGGINESGRA